MLWEAGCNAQSGKALLVTEGRQILTGTCVCMRLIWLTEGHMVHEAGCDHNHGGWSYRQKEQERRRIVLKEGHVQ